MSSFTGVLKVNDGRLIENEIGDGFWKGEKTQRT
jgi:hypothetical protein